MKKSPIFLILTMMLLLFAASAWGSLLRYDVYNSSDLNGNNLSGYVIFDDNPVLCVDSSEKITGINFQGIGFYFGSSAGSFSGDYFNIHIDVLPKEYSGYSEDVAFSANSSIGLGNSKTGIGWGNSSTGVWFNDDAGWYGNLEDYLVLPELLHFSACYLQYFDMETGQYNGWGISGGDSPRALNLARSIQPVPEPATILLVGSGMACLLLRRKK